MRIVRKGRSKNVFLVYREIAVSEHNYYWCEVNRSYFRGPYIIAFAFFLQNSQKWNYHNRRKISFILTLDYKDLV